MERERIDDGQEHAGHPPPSVGRDQDRDAPPPLGAAIGNGAFSRLLGSTVGRDVALRSASGQGAGPLAPEIAAEIEQARGGGQPVPGDVRAQMEAGLGTDLSSVRLHTDTRADHLNRSVQAEAFTTGTDVFFRSGAYAPGSADGQRLLAHELTHVVQQGHGQVEGGRVSHPDDPHEVEARQVADALVAPQAPPGPAVDRAVPEPVAGEEPEEEPLGADVSRQDLEEEEEEEEAGRQP